MKNNLIVTDKILSAINSNKLYISAIIAIIGIIIYQIIKRTINRILERDKKRNKLDKKGRTVVKLFTNITKYVVIAIVGVLILQIYGVNVNSLVAGLGLVSVVVGLAIQDPLKDIITGVNILTDDYFSLGDVIKVDDVEGKVVQLGVRTTKIKDVANGNILVLANRNISKVLKISEELYIDIPLSYEDKTEKIAKILNKVCTNIQKLEDVFDAKYLGIGSFADSAINYKLQINCRPETKITIRRNVYNMVKQELDKNGISIPYHQLTIHNRKSRAFWNGSFLHIFIGVISKL